MKKLWETLGWKLLAVIGSAAFAMSSWALTNVVDLKATAAQYEEHAAQQIRREDVEARVRVIGEQAQC
jgi:hypothetical protein